MSSHQGNTLGLSHDEYHALTPEQHQAKLQEIEQANWDHRREELIRGHIDCNFGLIEAAEKALKQMGATEADIDAAVEEASDRLQRKTDAFNRRIRQRQYEIDQAAPLIKDVKVGIVNGLGLAHLDFAEAAGAPSVLDGYQPVYRREGIDGWTGIGPFIRSGRGGGSAFVRDLVPGQTYVFSVIGSSPYGRVYADIRQIVADPKPSDRPAAGVSKPVTAEVRVKVTDDRVAPEPASDSEEPGVLATFHLRLYTTFGNHSMPGWMSARNEGILMSDEAELGFQKPGQSPVSVNGVICMGRSRVLRISYSKDAKIEDLPARIRITGSGDQVAEWHNQFGYALRRLGAQMDYQHDPMTDDPMMVLRQGRAVTVQLLAE